MKKYLNLLAIFSIIFLTGTGCDTTEYPWLKNDCNFDSTPPVANFTFTSDGLDITFTNTSTGAVACLWYFGDGIKSAEMSPIHSYSSAGEYVVELLVQNEDGEVSKTQQTVRAFGNVTGYFSANAITDRSGKFGRIFEFDATASQNAASISWDFGDGSAVTSAGTDFKIAHEFPDYDKYTVKAKVTGIGGDTDEFTAEVDVIAYNELLKGGSMEKDDAKYWTFKDYWTANGSYGDLEGTPAFVQDFGCTADGPSAMKGGCLRLGGENQPHDYSYTASFYQPIEVEEGEILEISADLKWGDRSMDDGVLFMCISDNTEDFGSDATAILQMINYWNPGAPLPAFDGNLAGIGLPDGCGYNGDGSPKVRYTVPATGTIYFGFEIRSVWGTCFGPGADFYFDNLSVKIIFE